MGQTVEMINDIAQKIHDGERITVEDAQVLFAHPNVAELGMLANAVRMRRHPEQVVTYNVGRNINYTNVCWVKLQGTAEEVEVYLSQPSIKVCMCVLLVMMVKVKKLSLFFSFFSLSLNHTHIHT